jgi:hypothetical protein
MLHREDTMKFMKVVLFCAFIAYVSPSQAFDLNIKPNFWGTLVDVQKAMETTLETWNQYAYGGTIQVLFELKPGGLQIGAETGASHLYYWEEQYYAYDPDPVPRWRWGDMWTWHLGGVIEKKLSRSFYLQGGASLHDFLNGSGITPGLSAAAGYAFPLSGSIRLPVEIRADAVFGNATPIMLRASVGLSFSNGTTK